MPYLYWLLSAKEIYAQWFYCRNRPATPVAAYASSPWCILAIKAACVYTMKADVFILLSFCQVNLMNPSATEKRPITADAALMNPVAKILALRSGENLQVSVICLSVFPYMLPPYYLHSECHITSNSLSITKCAIFT